MVDAVRKSVREPARKPVRKPMWKPTWTHSLLTASGRRPLLEIGYKKAKGASLAFLTTLLCVFLFSGSQAYAAGSATLTFSDDAITETVGGSGYSISEDAATSAPVLTITSAGTYTITELKAPDGYNILDDELELTIRWDETNGFTYAGAVDSDGAARITVVNQIGSELPSTGGIGTTVFYVCGGILLMAAVVLLVTKKRMAA